MDTFTIGWISREGNYCYMDFAGMDDVTYQLKKLTDSGCRVTSVKNVTFNNE
jgi:hypothetical protein